MKYRPSRRISYLLAEMLPIALTGATTLRTWDLVVPIPSSARHYRTRGFNQCEILCRSLNVAPVSPRALIHIRSCSPQALLDRKERAQNVRGVFSANRELVAGNSILLVDDVITSGATSTEAARELLRAGAKEIDLITLAKSETSVP